ncbi:hypothetical protein [Reichenbachiella sp. MALMAid0571]|uniref:tetratricopeptide repeat protein n=1 Tax=Reichenbachiella sp. MALMAid0571 TaxID=3143939 RepID=UPI0032DEF49E
MATIKLRLINCSLISVSLIILFSAQLYAQDCTSSEDCYQKGTTNNFTSQSIALLDKALKLAKKEKINPAKIYCQRGIKWLNGRSSKDALKDFEAAIKSDPTFFLAYKMKANIFKVQEKNYEKTDKFLKETIKTFPNNPEAVYEKAQNHLYYNKTDLAYTDFETAYNMLVMMMDGTDQIDTNTKGNICKWYAISYMKKNNLYVYDARALEILESGKNFSPDSPVMLGELVMAYYDNGRLQEATTVGNKAVSLDEETYKSKNVGGNFIVGIKAFEDKDYFKSASHLNYAIANISNPHPLIYYYAGLANWFHYYYNAPKLWSSHVAQIKNQLEMAYKYGQGTKYDFYAQDAKKRIPDLKF